MTRLTALIIATNDVTTFAVGPVDGKFQGVIGSPADHHAHPYMPLLSSPFEFDTAEAAVARMKDVVVEITEAMKEEGLHL